MKCPGCDGMGIRSAMSGCHMPYNVRCDDCHGTGTVTDERAAEIQERHRQYDERQKSYIETKLPPPAHG